LALDIEALYAKCGPMVLRRCRWMLGDEAKAEDAMQDVFVALLRHGGRLDDVAPSALALRVATNVCLNRLRSARRRPETADEALLRDIADASAGAEGRAVARDALRRLFRADDPLAASTGTLAVMHLLDGLTLEETAREAGLSVSGVRKRLRGLRLRALEGR
jgi:RNA polymerase sigma-70 factor (ECF subfamily)